MSYSIKESYYTLQGEGAHSGRPSIFCRFTGCNLWNGLEESRATAICDFCDTDFVGTDGPGGGKFKNAEDLVKFLFDKWPTNNICPFVVCTGGEPLLQIDSKLIQCFHNYNFEIAIETNGTVLPPEGIDWICVSPKVGADLLLTKGDELKFVFPQKDVDPRTFESFNFRHFYIQPMDGPDLDKNIKLAIEFCLKNPTWKLSLQTHRYLNIL